MLHAVGWPTESTKRRQMKLRSVSIRTWLVTAAPILVVVAAMLSPGWDLTKPIHAESAYWQKPLTCSGPDFREPPPDPDSALNEPRAIFRMSDQMVLAIPRHYLGGPWDEDLPATIAACRSIRDLPQIQHLTVRIRGSWSGTFNEAELPRDNNGDREYTDQLHLDILPPDVRPSWAAQKPVWNRAFISESEFRPLATEENGILCGGNSCWFPVPGEQDLYGWFQLLGGGSTELNLTPILLRGMTYRGLEISGRVMLSHIYQTLPAVIVSIQDHIDRWNIVRPIEVTSLTIQNTGDATEYVRGGPTNLDKNRGRDKWNSAGYAAAASG